MKAILISIKPKYVADILNDKKTLEIRKTMPKCELPIDVYIYCTKEEYLACDTYTGKRRYNAFPKGTNGFTQSGMVLAKFTLNKVEIINAYDEPERWYMTNSMGGGKLMEKSCLTYEELNSYLKGKNGYAWHIDNLVIFDRPKELNEFKKRNGCMDFQGYVKYLYEPLTKAPQSWQFVESEK